MFVQLLCRCLGSSATCWATFESVSVGKWQRRASSASRQALRELIKNSTAHTRALGASPLARQKYLEKTVVLGASSHPSSVSTSPGSHCISSTRFYGRAHPNGEVSQHAASVRAADGVAPPPCTYCTEARAEVLRGRYFTVPWFRMYVAEVGYGCGVSYAFRRRDPQRRSATLTETSFFFDLDGPLFICRISTCSYPHWPWRSTRRRGTPLRSCVLLVAVDAWIRWPG